MAELIVALDLPSSDEALRMADMLPGLRWAKIGPTLFIDGGPGVIRELKERGVRVFLDLKWHDIPSVVAGAARAAAEQGVDLATVHTLGGVEMLGAAVGVSKSMKLAAVSVLTSHSPETYWKAVRGTGGSDLGREVVRLTQLAVGAGVHGVVASPLEAAMVREVVGRDRWIVVPGIRPAGSPAGDQRRTAQPEEAVKAGATHLVVGRPITGAKTPRAVYESIREALT